jgi:cobalt-precorrin 5A hydrolase/precorrin-3B C17-methyltransferase
VTLAFVAFTPAGLATARSAQEKLGGEVHAKAARWAELAGSLKFSRRRDTYPRVVRSRPADCRLLRRWILIRILAPLLSDKRAEPPVLAVSEDGAEIVPLLGGHRGANDLACRLAQALGGHAAVTTAGDRRFGVALDEPPPGWVLANPGDAKGIMAELLAGASAGLEGEADWLGASNLPFSDNAGIRLVATTRADPGDHRTLVYHPKKIVVGVGCERGADPAEVVLLLRESIAHAGLAAAAIACIASIDVKADETAILEAARDLGVPVRFFSAAELEAEAPRLQTPSETVFREVGCHGVAEGAALAGAGAGGSLILAKRKSRRATCAIAEAANVVEPERIGRARGRLAIVGIGPGAPDWLTPEAKRLLQGSDSAVGYSLYLDLIAPLIAGAERFDSDLGSEEERVRRALTIAGSGRSVALISSGDAGIYAMATLAFECLEAGGLPDGAARAEIVVAPGISAMQAAAARAGAPLGHDFCAISLSDLLTPWEAIEARIRAAAEADFVVAFYNPVSRRRRSQLATAKAILLRHRPPDTPVVLGRNLGRDGESVITVALADLEVSMVDMLTLVIVGASSTRQVGAGGRTWTFTPRGYERKRTREAAE